MSFYSNVNSSIQFADHIARRVNNVYPRMSISKYETFSSSKNFTNLMLRLDEDLNWIRYKFSDFSKDKKGNYLSQWKYLVDLIKKYKFGNCIESANLSEIAARVNGINDCQIATINAITKNKTSVSLDHAVLLVNGKKPYIIDTWLGFADTIPNAFYRFQHEFAKQMGLEKNSKFLPLKLMPFGKKHSVTPELQQKLKENFPELII